jgi:mRNA-degrading endonuclease toxin of MazEF toxin-antitoxin module
MTRCGQQADHSAWTTLRVAHMPTGTTTTTADRQAATLPASPSTHSHTRWTDKRGPVKRITTLGPETMAEVCAALVAATSCG